MSKNGEIYTAGKKFTLPAVLTGWTNSTSGFEYVIVFPPFYNHADHKQHFASLGLGGHWGSTGGHWSPASLTLLHLPNQPNFNLTLHPGCRIPPQSLQPYFKVARSLQRRSFCNKC